MRGMAVYVLGACLIEAGRAALAELAQMVEQGQSEGDVSSDV